MKNIFIRFLIIICYVFLVIPSIILIVPLIILMVPVYVFTGYYNVEFLMKFVFELINKLEHKLE